MNTLPVCEQPCSPARTTSEKRATRRQGPIIPGNTRYLPKSSVAGAHWQACIDHGHVLPELGLPGQDVPAVHPNTATLCGSNRRLSRGAGSDAGDDPLVTPHLIPSAIILACCVSPMRITVDVDKDEIKEATEFLTVLRRGLRLGKKEEEKGPAILADLSWNCCLHL